MESFVTLIRQETYEEFVNSYPGTFKLLLFTEKKSTPPLFRALSKDFNDKLKFGEIRNSETSLVEKFSVQKFPTIMALTDEGGVFYDGVMKKDQLMKFMRTYANMEQPK